MSSTPSPSLAAVGSAYRAPASPDGECKGIIFRYDNRGYVQIEELAQTVDQIRYMEWASEMNNGNQVIIWWRNGSKQAIKLRMPAARLHMMGFICGKDGLAKLRVVDCQTNQPISGVIISEQGGRYQGLPTGKDGRAMVPCNCRPPQKDVVVLKKKGYQTQKVYLQFSGRKIDRGQACMKKVGATTTTTNKPNQPGERWRGHRYLVMLKPMDWNQARAYAKRVGGHLVTISDRAENDFVADLARRKGVKRSSWIGYSDQGSEGRWWWVTGQKTTFTAWHSNEPNNSEGKEHCCQQGWHSKTSWNDGACQEKLPFMIEWDR